MHLDETFYPLCFLMVALVWALALPLAFHSGSAARRLVMKRNVLWMLCMVAIGHTAYPLLESWKPSQDWELWLGLSILLVLFATTTWDRMTVAGAAGKERSEEVVKAAD